MKYRVNVRKFLNLKGYLSGAYVIAQIQDTTDLGKNDWPFVRPTLTISDCSRVVDLEFHLYSAGARRNSLRKIDLLISTLEEFRAALEIEADLASTRRPAHDLYED